MKSNMNFKISNLSGNQSKLRHIFSSLKLLRFWLREDHWLKLEGGIKTPASRNDLISTLTNIESIKIRASFGPGMTETRLRKIMLDIAIPQNTGFVAKSVETCLCPKGNVTRS